ncbi:MAG: N-acetylmuramoyl-L-alanine amidase [Candidatus Nanopelagicales bacterium]
MNKSATNGQRFRLALGDQAPAVVEVRERLARLGYLAENSLTDSASNDVYDEDIYKAVRAFQLDRGIDSDGIVGLATFKRLEEARWNLGDRILSYSATHMAAGDDVLALQQRLNDLGFDAGRVDGVFGPDTDRAVREFQRNVGTSADGTCGPEMWADLDRLNRAVTGGASRVLRSEHFYDQTRTGVANKVVILDPGHGGPDYGTVANRLAESIVADDLARRIEGRLAALGTQVLITRPTSMDLDYEISEAQRAQYANENGADLLVSLHTNSHSNPDARGVATYYFGHEKGGSALGQWLAELMLDEIVARTDLPDCRPHGKTWDLLRITRMPAVRIEAGFLTSPQDAARLEDAAFRDALADAIAQAIVAFFDPTANEEDGHEAAVEAAAFAELPDQ